MVRTFDPTAVPNEFATSFAPTAKARRNAKRKAKTEIHFVSFNQSSFDSSTEDDKTATNAVNINNRKSLKLTTLLMQMF